MIYAHGEKKPSGEKPSELEEWSATQSANALLNRFRTTPNLEIGLPYCPTVDRRNTQYVAPRIAITVASILEKSELLNNCIILW